MKSAIAKLRNQMESTVFFILQPVRNMTSQFSMRPTTNVVKKIHKTKIPKLVISLCCIVMLCAGSLVMFSASKLISTQRKERENTVRADFGHNCGNQCSCTRD